jgi:hypothetical protein
LDENVVVDYAQEIFFAIIAAAIPGRAGQVQRPASLGSPCRVPAPSPGGWPGHTSYARQKSYQINLERSDSVNS